MLYFMGSNIIQPMELGPTDDNYFICCRMRSLTRGQASEQEEEEEDEGRKEEEEQRRRQGGAAVEDIKEFVCCDVDVE
jgi:hypothetical protein